MALDLSPKFANKKIFEGEGGSYYSWPGTGSNLLGESKVGAGILLLKPGGFALPHYADCSKVGYVLQVDSGGAVWPFGFAVNSGGLVVVTGELGTKNAEQRESELGVAGMVLPNDQKHSQEEIVLGLRKGDVIPVPLGSASWWYNNGSSDVVIVFVGETSRAYVPGEFSYFLLTGAQGILGGFSSEFTGRAYNMNENEAKILAKSQTGVLIIKLGQDESEKIPLPHQHGNANLMVNNFANFPADFCVKKAGMVTSFTGSNFPFLEQVGLSCTILKLDANAMLSPTYTADSVQVFYVVKGSGKVQIVGLNAKLVLDSEVEAGQLLVVPRCFAVAIIAGPEGIEPAIGKLGGKQSVMNGFSASVVQLALNLNEESLKFFKEKVATSEILIPPKC
ncbi:hypothetical protein WN944_006372 [Citrus x changshan-huyou]|uniref:Cupin type-1 domain-containing protein n=2 Tax=Citrus TaxID=2706 RepID=A0AAP0QTF9_9ROSI